jgi:hypothetical protein
MNVGDKYHEAIPRYLSYKDQQKEIRMSRRRHVPRMLIGVAAAAVIVIPAALITSSSGSAAAPETAAQLQYTPSNTVAPTISGTAQAGQKLTATTGTWSSSTTISYTYQWDRCNTAGAGCASISGATATTYAVLAADVGATLRVVVTAHNADGATSATSAQTAVVGSSGPAGATKEANGRTSVAIASISLPDRLTIDQVKFDPSIVRSSTSITARFHVTETKGYDISGALVSALGLPYSRVTTAPEATTGTDGWATIQFQPAKLFPHKGYVTFFVRARKNGDDALGGISTRRLVQLTINRA